MKRFNLLFAAALSFSAAVACAAAPAGASPAAGTDPAAGAGRALVVFEDVPPEVDVAALIQAAPGEQAAPLDDAVLLFDHTDVTVRPDGRVNRRRHQVIKIMNEYAQRGLCDPRVTWNTETQDLVIHTLRTHMSDGTIVEQTSGMDRMHNISPVTPDGLDRCPDYLHHQEAVVSFLAIDLGSVVDFDYSIRDRRPLQKWVSGAEVLQGDAAAMERRLTLRIPAGAAIQWNELNGAPRASESNENGVRILTWAMKDVPGVRIETDCAGAPDFLPAVAFTIWTGDPEDRYGWHRELMREMEAAAEPGEMLTAKGGELCKSAGSLEERFAALHGFAREAVRRVRFAFLDLNEPARPAERVYATAYASAKDHAVLLWALCRAAGIEARPVLVSPCNVTGALGVQDVMRDVLLAVELDHGRFLVDPAGPFDRDLALTIPERRIFMPPRTDNPFNIMSCSVSVTGDLAFGPSLEASGSLRVDHSGPGNPFLKLRGGEGTRDRHLESVASLMIAGGKMEGHVVHELARHRSCYTVDVAAPAAERAANGSIHVALLQPVRLVEDILPGLFMNPPASRSGPVALDHAVTVDARLELTLPEGYDLVYLPESAEMVNDYGGVSMSWSRDGQKLQYRCLIDLARAAVDAADYAGFREIILQAADPRASLIVLRQTGGGS